MNPKPNTAKAEGENSENYENRNRGRGVGGRHDGAAVSEERVLLRAEDDSEVIVFDLV